MCGISVVEFKCVVLVLERFNMCGASVLEIRKLFDPSVKEVRYVWC